jgi:hypothetical protein
LRRLLNQPAGQLTYSGKGFGNMVINKPATPPGEPVGGGGLVATGLQDVCWGPIPETFEFVPLGASGAANVKWTVAFCLPEVLDANGSPILQFNEETTVSYDEEDYSTITIKGTLEVGMTRATVNTRTVAFTVDDYRQRFLDKLALSIDLLRFRVTRRDFNVNRDKRTMEWNFQAEELPPMSLPAGATKANGRMSVRMTHPSVALFRFLVTLSATYVIRKDQPRRVAWGAFLSLWHFRMNQAPAAVVPDLAGINADDQQPAPKKGALDGVVVGPVLAPLKPVLNWLFDLLKGQQNKAPKAAGVATIPQTFGFDEGIYLDSKTVTFEASWLLMTTFTQALTASGAWEQPQAPDLGRNNWAISIADISRSTSWTDDILDPSQDVIVDFGAAPQILE